MVHKFLKGRKLLKRTLNTPALDISWEAVLPVAIEDEDRNRTMDPSCGLCL